MKKFYEKNELWFSIVCIIVYVMVMGNLRADFGDDSIFSVLGISVLAGILTIFIYANHLQEKYGLISVKECKKLLYFAPLLILMSVNFWPGVSIHYSPVNQVFAVLTLVLAGYVEELLFRGFLFRAIEKDSVRQAVIISAVTFGAGHIINLFTGQAGLDTILQMAYAIAIGFAFVMVFLKSKSLWPCVIAHSFINATSTIAGECSDLLNILISVVIILVAGSYAVYLHKRA